MAKLSVIVVHVLDGVRQRAGHDGSDPSTRPILFLRLALPVATGWLIDPRQQRSRNTEGGERDKEKSNKG